MENANLFIIGLNLFVIVLLIIGKLKANKENLLLTLKIESIILLCFLPIFILLFVFGGINIEEMLSIPIVVMSLFTIICLTLTTSILYMLKQKKSTEEKTEAIIEVQQQMKRRRIVMIPAFVLPMLVFAGMLFYKSIRSDRLLLTIIITAICVLLFLLILFMRKLR